MASEQGDRVDCLIVGGGAAGLAAARDLTAAGARVALVEARNRLGGRIHTVRDPGSILPIELGAEFVHGEAEDTFAVIRAARVIVDQLPDGHYWSADGHFSGLPNFWEKITDAGRDIAKHLARATARDVSFQQYLDQSHWSPKLKRLFLQYVEGYHAADPARISARFLAVGSDEVDHGNTRQFRVVSGYDTLIQWMAKSLDPELATIRLNTNVETISWRKREVVAEAAGDGGIARRSMRARSVIVTVPSALVAAEAVRFEPELPEKVRAARRLELGQVFRMVLRFREPFWAEDDFVKKRLANARRDPEPLNFVHDLDRKIGTWWTALPARADTLTAWAGGPKAQALLDQAGRAQLDQVLEAMSQTFGVPRTLVDDCFDAHWHHDWRADPFSRCAYSYPGVGGVPAQKALARPVDGTVFFAGEATDSDQTATVAGAIASGRRAAKEVMGALRLV